MGHPTLIRTRAQTVLWYVLHPALLRTVLVAAILAGITWGGYTAWARYGELSAARPTPTVSISVTTTATPSPVVTPTPSASSSSPSATPSPTPTPTPTPTAKPVPVPKPSATARATQWFAGGYCASNGAGATFSGARYTCSSHTWVKVRTTSTTTTKPPATTTPKPPAATKPPVSRTSTYTQSVTCNAPVRLSVSAFGSGTVTSRISGPASGSGGRSVSVTGPAGTYTLSATDTGGNPGLSWSASGATCR